MYCKESTMSKFLTEEILFSYLKIIYPGYEWVHDKSFIKGKRVRPDYRCEELKVIVEFDGYNHYNSTSRIISDINNTELYESFGYKVVRIPYFVQMSSVVIKHLFNVDVIIEQTFPQGFVSDSVYDLLPCDFTVLGIEKFKKDLERFDYIKDEIIESLKIKIEKLKDKRLVLPECLYYLVEC